MIKTGQKTKSLKSKNKGQFARFAFATRTRVIAPMEQHKLDTNAGKQLS
jgi:hypothetical protein